MHDLRNKKTFNFNFFKKLKWIHLLYLLIGIILIFPEESGNIIGTWILDFFVTIINIIKNG